MLEWFEIVTRLVAAAAIGGGIGLNRHLHHKATGVRTLGIDTDRRCSSNCSAPWSSE